MSFVNDVMAEEAGRKSLILFEDDSVFQTVDLHPTHDSTALKKKYWLNFLLVTTVLILAIVSVNQLPASQTLRQDYSIAKQFHTVDLELPVAQVKATVIQKAIVEKSVEPEELIIKASVPEEKKLVQQSSAERKLEKTQTPLRQVPPKNPQPNMIVQSAPKADQVLDLTTSRVVFNKKILSDDIQNTPLHDSVNMQFSHAKMLLQHGKVVSAITELQQIMTLDKHHLDARLLLSSKLIEQGEVQEAFKVYQNGLLLTPGESRLAKPLAHLLVEQGKVDQSLQVLQQAAPSINSDPDYHSFIAALQQQTGRHGKAITIYQQILKSQPENGKWWLGLGISLMAEAKNKEALLAFESSLRDERVSSALKQFASQRILDLKGSQSENRGRS